MKYVVIVCITVCIALGVTAGSFKLRSDNLGRALHSEKQAHVLTR